MFVLSCSLEIVLICGPTGDASTHVFIFVVKTVRAFGDFLSVIELNIQGA